MLLTSPEDGEVVGDWPGRARRVFSAGQPCASRRVKVAHFSSPRGHEPAAALCLMKYSALRSSIRCLRLRQIEVIRKVKQTTARRCNNRKFDFKWGSKNQVIEFNLVFYSLLDVFQGNYD